MNKFDKYKVSQSLPRSLVLHLSALTNGRFDLLQGCVSGIVFVNVLGPPFPESERTSS
jgi:hypothetical protein